MCLPPAVRTGVRLLFLVGGLLLVLGLPLVRMLPEESSRLLAFLCFGWMGFIAIATPITLLGEVPKFWVRRARDVDESRRQVLVKGVATVTTLTASTAVARGVDNALAAPDIVHVNVPISQRASGLRA